MQKSYEKRLPSHGNNDIKTLQWVFFNGYKWYYCMAWKENEAKNGTIHGCDEEYYGKIIVLEPANPVEVK